MIEESRSGGDWEKVTQGSFDYEDLEVEGGIFLVPQIVSVYISLNHAHVLYFFKSHK